MKKMMLITAAVLIYVANTNAQSLIDVFKSVEQETIWATGTGRTPNTDTVTLTVNAFGDSVVASIPADVFLSIDHSTSMIWDDAGNTLTGGPVNPNSRMALAHGACSSFARTLLSDTTVENRIAVQYSWGMRSMDYHSLPSGHDDYAWVPKQEYSSDLTATLQYLGDTTHWEGTYILTALDSALDYTLASKRNDATGAIILLSDGAGFGWERGEERWGITPPYSDRNRMELMVLTKVLQYSRLHNIKVYPIGFGNASSYALLDTIASRSGTTVRKTSQGSDLSDIYQEIAKELRTYAVARVSPSSPLIIDQIDSDISVLGQWPTANNNTLISGFTNTGNVLSWDVPEIEIDSTFEVAYSIQSDQPGWNNLYVGTNNMVNYQDALGNPGSEPFPRRRVLVLEEIKNDAAWLLDAEALSWQSIRVLVDTNKFASMAIDTVMLYYSSSGYVENLTASHIRIPVRQIRDAGGWYTVSGLNEQTTYYFTVAFRNFIGELTNLSASRGQSRATLFHYPNTIAIVTGTDGTGQVSSATVSTDDNLHYYAAGYDGSGAFIRNYAVDWSGPFFNLDADAATDVTFSPDSVGSGDITVTLPESTVVNYTATLTVNVGALSSIRINGGSGGSGEVTDQGIASDQTLTLWAGAYDADGNFISDVSAAWSVTGDLQAGDLSGTTGSSVSFSPSATSATGGYIIATASGVSDSVNITSIFSGTVTRLRIRDAAGGGGNEVDTLSVVAGYSRTLYLAAYDVNDTYLSDVSGTWGSIEQTPSFSYTGTGSQYAFAPLQAGIGRLTAVFNGTVADTTGVIRVLGAEPDSLAIISFPSIITAGQEFNNVVINAWDELGNPTSQYTATDIVWQFTDPSASNYGYTISTPDPIQTFTSGVLDSSTISGYFRLVNTGTNSVRIGVVVAPGDTVWSSYTPSFQVMPGAGYKVEIRISQTNYTPPDTIPVQKVLTDVLTLYAGLHDSMGNHIEDRPVRWSNTWPYPVIDPPSINTTITQTWTLAGNDTIRISDPVYENDRLPVRILDADGPRIVFAYALDASGDGYVDSVYIKFNEVLESTGAVSTAGLQLNGMNAFTIATATANAADSSVSITAQNSGADLASAGDRPSQDSGNPPNLIITTANRIADTTGNYAVPDTFHLEDRAGPVISKAVIDDGGTDNDASDDVLQIYLSESVDDATWGGGSGISMYVDSLFEVIGLGTFGTGAFIRTVDPNDNYLEIVMGADGTALTPGADMIKLVADSTTTFADLQGNVVHPDNDPILIHMQWSEKLIMDVVNYPNPFRATTSGTFAQSGPQRFADIPRDFKGTLIKYTLSSHADAELSILGPIGTLVDRFSMKSGEPGGHEGVNFFCWNGTNGKGRVVESGAYIVILKVVSSADGASDKVTRKVGVIKE